MDRLNPEIEKLFRAKEQRRMRLAAMPFHEKVRGGRSDAENGGSLVAQPRSARADMGIGAVRRLSEHVVIINGMMVTNEPEFDMIGTEEFEDDAVCVIDSKAPHFMMLGMELFSME
ncbi:MAG TPA: hypothetical protein VLE46_12550 [Nitrospira sp.]|nr:hypothetical protein [Nitrospira sp.]